MPLVAAVGVGGSGLLFAAGRLLLGLGLGVGFFAVAAGGFLLGFGVGVGLFGFTVAAGFAVARIAFRTMFGGGGDSVGRLGVVVKLGGLAVRFEIGLGGEEDNAAPNTCGEEERDESAVGDGLARGLGELLVERGDGAERERENVLDSGTDPRGGGGGNRGGLVQNDCGCGLGRWRGLGLGLRGCGGRGWRGGDDDRLERFGMELGLELGFGICFNGGWCGRGVARGLFALRGGEGALRAGGEGDIELLDFGAGALGRCGGRGGHRRLRGNGRGLLGGGDLGFAGGFEGVEIGIDLGGGGGDVLIGGQRRGRRRVRDGWRFGRSRERAGGGALDLVGDFREEGVGGCRVRRVGCAGRRIRDGRGVEGGDGGVRGFPTVLGLDAELIREGIDAGVEVRGGIGMGGVVAHAWNETRGRACGCIDAGRTLLKAESDG